MRIQSFTVCHLTFVFPLCASFCPSDQCRGVRRHCFTQRFAKTPPTAKFDLTAIEAFEELLSFQDVEDKEEEEAYDSLEMEDDNTDDVDGVREYSIDESLHGKRIDAAIAALNSNLSRSLCGNLVTDGCVQIIDENGKRQVVSRKAFKVESGTMLRVQIPVEEKPTEIVPQNLPLSILYEDQHMIVLNKAADMVVHPAAGHWDGTVVNALAHYLATSAHGSGDFVGTDGSLQPTNAEGIAIDGTDGETITFRPGIVHRLDKGTTGVLVVAKTRASLAALSDAFKARSVKKTYLAVTVGNPGRRVVIDKPIGRHPVHRQRMRVVPDPHNRDYRGLAPKDRMADNRPLSQAGRRALSFVDTITFDGKLSLAQIRIETGRTHQIRVHLQDRGCPVFGDDVYGLPDWNRKLAKTHQIARPLLHAYTLEIAHPITGEPLSFRAPMPDDLLKISTAIWPQGSTERPDLFGQ